MVSQAMVGNRRGERKKRQFALEEIHDYLDQRKHLSAFEQRLRGIDPTAVRKQAWRTPSMENLRH